MFGIFVQQIMLLTIYHISLAHKIYCKLLIMDIANTLLKRSVGSRWWLVGPHGHYHHGLDHRTYEGAQLTVGLCWVRWWIKIKI